MPEKDNFKANAVRMTDKQLLAFYLSALVGAVNRGVDAIVKAINEQTENNGKWQSLQNDSIKAGFEQVAEVLAKPQPPEPPPAQNEGGQLVARYRIPEDQPPLEFELVGKDFKSAKGTPVGAADIDLSIESNNTSLTAEAAGPQRLSEDGNQVILPVRVTAQSATVDMAVASYKATNRDTGNVVAADSDEFIIGPGEASIGTIDSPVPGLTPEEEAPPPPEA